MAETKAETESTIKAVQLPGGGQAYILDAEQLKALTAMIEDKLWWQETQKRLNRFGILAAAALAGLALLASWWPWITRVMQLILQDVPK